MAIVQTKHENLPNFKNKDPHTATEVQNLQKTIQSKNKNRDDDTKYFTHLRSNIIFILINVLMDRFAY